MRKDATHLGPQTALRGVLACLAVLFTSLAAWAQDAKAPLRFVHEPWSEQEGSADAASQPGLRYGQEDYVSWAISYSAAYQAESFDQGLTLSYNRFLVDDIEWLLEAGLWSFYDRGADAAYGLSVGFGFRWHFLTRERWSLFADLGMAILGTTDGVPPQGTHFNFMPRAGVGMTYQIDETIRLIGGVRWHHVSNARTRGDARNPARDAPLAYVGLIIPF